jgi:hypothetical protein
MVVSSSDRITALRDRLAAHPYQIGAGEFIRFRVDANDDVVAGIVRTVIAEGEQGCELFRRGLGVEESDTLRLFAMRRTLQARRQSSSGSTFDAFDGFALLPGIDDVPWDSWLKAALFVARSLGVDLDSIGNRFADVANGDALNRYNVAREAMNRVEDISQCRMAEATTTYGVGFIEILVFRDTRTRGRASAPTLGDNRIEYGPTTNLAQLAAGLADALDGSGKVVTNPISQDQLAATLFSLTASGSYLPVAGCLSFTADEVDGSGSFTAFVAELPDDADVDSASMAQAASDTDGQAAVFDAQRLIVFCTQPSFDDDVDVVLDFHDVQELASTALIDPATR